MRRRQWLVQATALAAGGALPAWAAVALPAQAAATVRRAAPRFAATWADNAGAPHLGVLEVADPAGALRIVRTTRLPGRAHGLLVEPGGTVLAAARRPGDWVLRWSPASGATQWFACAPDRQFTGHLLHEPGGARLFSAETDAETGQGLIAVRDARTLALQAEWPTHGIDPHQFIVDADGSLLVANGGVTTRPETGRTKLALDRMDASLVRLDASTGTRLGQWRLAETRLSIRHLARDAGGRVGIALQAEHDDAATKASAPVLALFDGAALRTAEAPQALAGYGGDIAASAAGFSVSVPRAGGVAHWSRNGQWAGFTPLAEACALASTAAALWAGGRTQVATWPGRADIAANDGDAPHHFALVSLRLDNHWVALPPG